MPHGTDGSGDPYHGLRVGSAFARLQVQVSRERIDRLLVTRGLTDSRARARALIEAGKVRVDGALIDKPSALVFPDAELTLDGQSRYVSRGGEKLEGALHDLDLSVRDLTIADIGASTGGFTQCALVHGARRVYAIDVGHDQLHASLRGDARVVSREGVNARALAPTDLPERVDMVLVDASFISLVKLLPALVPLLSSSGALLLLVKPQFEVGPENVGKRGVVRADALRQQAVDEVVQAASAYGLVKRAQVDCRLHGPEGNREIFILLERAPA